MPTTEATDRIQLVFSLFDADGNGAIESTDFDLMGRRVVAAVPEAGDAAKDRMLAAFSQFWETLATELDANGDGRISPEEFAAVVFDPARFDAALGEFAESLSAMGDADGDGLVGREDFLALMLAIGFERPNIEALFEAFGPVEADRIRATTWSEGIRDYYHPERADTPGNHLTAAAAR